MAPSLDPVAAGASDLRYSLFKTIYPTPANGQCITDHGHPGPVIAQLMRAQLCHALEGYRALVGVA